MNNTRRRQITVLTAQLETLKDELEGIEAEESEYRDNVPENLQESDRYYASEAAIDLLTEIACDLAEALSKLEQVE